MKAWLLPVALGAGVFVVVSCSSSTRHIGDGDGDVDADADSDSDVLECGDERAPVDVPPEPIVNGDETWDREVVDLTEGQALAVGALMTMDGREWTNVCTATLIAPHLILTAGHCVLDWSGWTPGTLDPSDVRFGVGPDLREPDHLFAPVEVHSHPSYEAGWGGDATNDMALLVLGEDATASLPGIEPIAVNCTSLERGTFVGQDVQNVGYGSTETGWGAPHNTRQWWTVEEVTDLTSYDYTVYGHGESAVCGGDSGGPSLWTMPDGVIRVVGTVSWGDASCVDYDHFARADDNCDFIESYMEGCGDVTRDGYCEGDTAIWCEGGSVMRVDCAATGRICGDADDGQMRCLDVDPCGGETFEGRCDGNVALWCDDGEIERQDCADVGMLCGVTEDGRFRCMGGDDEPCGDLDWTGRCEGDDALWCEDDRVRVRRCADCEQSCGWSETHNAYYCI